MDYRTAASVGQNLSAVADAFLQMNDPAKIAALRMHNAQLEGQQIENQYRPGMFKAQTDAYGANAAQSRAAAELSAAQSRHWGIRNSAGEGLMNDVPGAGVLPPRTTAYSFGAAVGGGDEMQDSWTNKGYTSTGRNLSPGVVAVGSRAQLGTVYRDQNGRAYIAADTHGNKDKSVVDIFQPNYNPAAVAGLQLQPVGKVDVPYGTTPEALAAIRAQYERQATLSNVFNGGGAADLAAGTAKMAGLTANSELDARRVALGQGIVFNHDENFLPDRQDAYNQANRQADLQKQALVNQGDIQQEFLRGLMAPSGRRGSGSAPGGSVDGISKIDIGDVHTMVGRRFGVPDEATKSYAIAPEMQSPANSWQTSYGTLIAAGVDPIRAETIADSHHRITSVAMEAPWFGGPKMVAGKNFNPIPITPEQASGFAPAMTGATGMSIDPGLLQAFGLAPAQQTERQQQPIPQTGVPPMLQRPPETGGESAAGAFRQPSRRSDSFQAREGSREREARIEKQKKAARIRAQIDTIAKQLETGEVSYSPAASVGGAFGYVPPGGPQTAKLTDDGYNSARQKMIQLEDELAKLEGGRQTTPSTAQGTVRRYNPATGRIE